MRAEIIVKVSEPDRSDRPLYVEVDDAGHARAVVHTLDVEFDVAPIALPNETVWDFLRRVVESGEAATGLSPQGRASRFAKARQDFDAAAAALAASTGEIDQDVLDADQAEIVETSKPDGET